jgi:hypothetical protein
MREKIIGTRNFGGADMPVYPVRLSKPLSIRVPESPQKYAEANAAIAWVDPAFV